jgi:lipoate-protein ligase A
MEMRVIFDGKNRATWNMALDESLLKNLKNIGATLRLYGWKPSAISIGYFQSLDDEVNVERAREIHVDIVRRITGGGAVYHKWEVTYSITMLPPPGSILGSYKMIERGIIQALRKIGLDAQYSGVNDISVNGKKISGNAQTRRYGGLLQHGTILMDVNVEEMFSLLKVPNEKIRDKMIDNVKERVTSLKHLGKDLEFEELQKILAEGFKKALGVNLYEEVLPSEVIEDAKELEVKKYASREWLYRR